jgi:uncharacterized protein (TIGR03437 family)
MLSRRTSRHGVCRCRGLWSSGLAFVLLAAAIGSINSASAQTCTFSLNPTSQDFTSSGGTGLVTINATPPGCITPRTASTSTPWITINFGTSGNGAGSVGYAVQPNTGPESRTGSLTIAGQTFSVTQAGTPCTFSINPSSQTFTSDGGTGAINISATPNGCQSARNATTAASWITLSSGASGTGAGTLVYTVSANTTSSSRSATITVAGRTFTVNQDAVACGYSITPSQANFPAAGGNDQVTITASPQGCSSPRTATSAVNWITISFGATGNGSGTVGYSVQANNFTVERTGSMTIAGRTFTVNQAAGSCTFTLSPASSTIPTSGGSSGFNITASNQACSWTAVNNNPEFISFTSGDSGTGNGRIDYTVGANALTTSRTGSISVGASSHNVTQTAGCRVTATPTGANYGGSGGTGSFQVATAGSGCSWTATPNHDFITITSGGSGTSSGTVNYAVAPNVTASDRVGSISVNDFGFTIFQSANCTYTFSSNLISLPAVGGSGSFSVTSTCPWTAQTSGDWILINPSTGTGNGSIGFTVAGNTSSQPRSGTISIGSTTYRINQEGVACSVQINPSAVPVPNTGGSYNIAVEAPSGCDWGASTVASFISIAKADGAFTFTVMPNSDPQVRKATITVADKSVAVTQDAAVCDYKLTPNRAAFGSSGGSGSFAIATTCGWTAQSQASWILVPESSSAGSGDGTVNFNVARLTGTEARTGSIRVGPATFTITQSTSPCAINVAPSDLSIPGAGGRSVIRVTGGSSCRWTPSADSDWLSIASWSSINGTGVVNLLAAPNPAIDPRETQVRISAPGVETQSVTIIQTGLVPIIRSISNSISHIEGGPFAPGTLIRLEGLSLGPDEAVLADRDAADDLPTDLQGVQLLLNGVPAPLISVSRSRIESIVPFSLLNAQTAQVVVRNQGIDSEPVTIDLTPASPAIFTADPESGVGQALATNQNGSRNSASNAAARNETVTLWITGAGAVRPDGIDGRIYRQANALPVPVQNISVQVGGQPATLTAASVVLGETAGVIRFSIRIAQNAATGPAVPVVVRVGQTPSQASVTLAIR